MPSISEMRSFTDLGIAKLRRCRSRERRNLLRQALAVGMSMKEFKQLSSDGPDAPAMADDLTPKLKCSKCGGKAIGLTYTPSQSLPSMSG